MEIIQWYLKKTPCEKPFRTILPTWNISSQVTQVSTNIETSMNDFVSDVLKKIMFFLENFKTFFFFLFFLLINLKA